MQNPSPKKSTGLIIAIVVVLTIIVAGVALSLSSLNGSSKANTTNSGQSQQQATYVTETLTSDSTSQVNANIVNGLITVNAGQYETYQIVVPSNAGAAQVSGTFTASGGSGNDIIVLIMDYTDYVNWQNGHQASAYYTTGGQETTGTISATLPAGATYYLVYSNTFSTFSQKNVNTQVNVAYTTSTPVTYTTVCQTAC